jgi:hypothetical protein
MSIVSNWRSRSDPTLGRVVIGAVMASLWIGCSGIRVNSDWNPEADFSKLHSWNWSPISFKKSGNPTIDGDTIFANRVRTAVERELAAKGFRKVDDVNPDFQLAFFLVVEDKLSVTTINNHYGYGPGWGPHYGYGTGWGYGAGGVGSHTTVDQYKEGTLVIDISDDDENSLIWRGSGSTRLSKSPTPEKSNAKVDEAVKQILSRFPPKQK